MTGHRTRALEKCAGRFRAAWLGGRRRRRDEAGFIIVAVLWILAILAALIATYAVYVANAGVSLSVNDDRVQSEALISAALELTAYQLTSVDQTARPARGEFSFSMGRSNVAVEFLSETARIDLNAASKELLAGLFAALGASHDDAGYYADRVVAWRTKAANANSNSEADAYRTAGLSYQPRQGPFPAAGELPLVLGLPPALVEQALPFVTVYSGQSTVDVLDAAPQIIAALPGMSPDRLYAFLQQRASAPQNPQAVFALLGSAQSYASLDPGNAVRVTVGVAFANGRRVGAEAVILLLKDSDRPYRILYWRDDFDGAV
jgi:general secretion pathway protein K